jgi:hypothetical protein
MSPRTGQCNITLCSRVQGAVGISRHAAAKEDVGRFGNALKTEAALLKLVEKRLGVFQNGCKVINVGVYILVALPIVSHPNVRVGFGRLEAHLHQRVEEEIVPRFATCSEAVQGLENHH